MTSQEAASLAAQHNLRRVDQTGTIRSYLRECWTLRHFTWNYAVSRTILETVQNRLGLLWQVLNPLMLSGVYYLAFGLLLGTKSDSKDFLVFLVGGVFTWQCLASTIQQSSMVLAQTTDITDSLLFPRILLPLAVAIQEFLGALAAGVVMYPIALFYGLTPTWSWLLLPFSFLAASLFGVSVGFFTSRWVNAVHDLRQFIPLLLRVGMFLSGVFYDVSTRFRNAPDPIRVLAEYNPAAILLKLTRAVFLDYELPSTQQLLWIATLTVLLFVAGFLTFWRSERRNG
jgi:teichoic acid transport system permease protein